MGALQPPFLWLQCKCHFQIIMVYYLKGLVARFLDIFDPDDYSYSVVDDPNPLTLYPHVQQHIQSKIQ
jgi:hypothetical protein